MVKKLSESTLSEQQVCTTCGFCCDGTLFNTAVLDADEKGNLPEGIEKNYIVIKDKEYFSLPCPYFNKLCTIYKNKKANICSSFRCQLLKTFAQRDITISEAIRIIQNSKATRDELLDRFNQLSVNGIATNFRQLLIKLGEKQKELDNKNVNVHDWDLLTGRCNIFESLLIRHFKSEKSFQEMVMKDNG